MKNSSALQFPLFEKLDSFLNEMFDESLSKFKRWNKNQASKALEIMGFEKWDLSFDDFNNDSFPSFWVNGNGLYAVLYNSKIQMTFLTSDDNSDWMVKSRLDNNKHLLMTQHGYTVSKFSFSIKSFESLEKFFKSKEYVKGTLLLKEWSPIFINEMVEDLANYKSFAYAHFKDALNIYIEGKNVEKNHLILERLSKDYLSFIEKNTDLTKNSSVFIDGELHKFIKNINPKLFLPDDKKEIRVEEIKFLSDFFRGKSNIPWESVKEYLEGEALFRHPLLLCVDFITRLRQSPSLWISHSSIETDNVIERLYTIVDDIFEKLSDVELKEIWDARFNGKKLFFNFLMTYHLGLPELECLFEKIRKNSKLNFIDDSLFNFKEAFNDVAYNLAILNTATGQNKYECLRDGLFSFLNNTPEVFNPVKNSHSTFSYLDLLLNDMSNLPSNSTAMMVHGILLKVVNEKELNKQLSPNLKLKFKPPRF